ncbi:MAG: hypothetical protein ABL951_01200 [Alphaproteobacteria bacterium]
MNRWPRLFRDEKGFIPMLLALLIALGGLVSVGALILNRSATSLRSGKANLEQLAELEKSIRAYAYMNHRLPCPANGDDATGAVKATCTGGNNDGVVPWRDLGLTKEAVKDPYGRLISYSVDPGLSAGSVCTGTSPVNSALPGAIRINPSANTSFFVLISHGPNGYGGWLPAGGQSASPASSQERENCTDSAASVTCADPDPLAVTQGPYQPDPDAPNYFDDVILAAKSADYTALCAATSTADAVEDDDGRGRRRLDRDRRRNRDDNNGRNDRNRDRDRDDNNDRNGRNGNNGDRNGRGND